LGLGDVSPATTCKIKKVDGENPKRGDDRKRRETGHRKRGENARSRGSGEFPSLSSSPGYLESGGNKSKSEKEGKRWSRKGTNPRASWEGELKVRIPSA